MAAKTVDTIPVISVIVSNILPIFVEANTSLSLSLISLIALVTSLTLSVSVTVT